MISRLSTFASVFAVLATASLAFATSPASRPDAAPVEAARTARVVQLEPVVIVGRRSDLAVR